MPRTMEGLLQEAFSVFGSEVKTIFNPAGNVITGLGIVRDGDLLFVAGDKPFIPGKELVISTHVNKWCLARLCISHSQTCLLHILITFVLDFAYVE
jgi:hypothetical protein